MAVKGKKKKVKRVARSIVVGHLERISSQIFVQNRKLIAEMMEGHYGVSPGLGAGLKGTPGRRPGLNISHAGQAIKGVFCFEC